MMGVLLDELIAEIKNEELDQQVREICEKIWIQETEGMKKPQLKTIQDLQPDGPNIFLSLPCPGRIKKEIAFLTLEREMIGEYVVGFWAKSTVKPNDVMKRYRLWKVKEVNSPRIIKAFAEKLKYVRGK